jgi:N utilization substance protein B
VKARSRARGWALQALYAWEARGGDEDRLVPILEELYENLHVSPRNRLYTDVLVRLVAKNVARIDSLLEQNLTNWSLRRLAVVDRNVLRLGVAEMLFVDEVPAPVTIREMVQLAERYGTPESARFVNGVLDAIMRGMEAAQAESR